MLSFKFDEFVKKTGREDVKFQAVTNLNYKFEQGKRAVDSTGRMVNDKDSRWIRFVGKSGPARAKALSQAEVEFLLNKLEFNKTMFIEPEAKEFIGGMKGEVKAPPIPKKKHYSTIEGIKETEPVDGVTVF